MSPGLRLIIARVQPSHLPSSSWRRRPLRSVVSLLRQARSDPVLLHRRLTRGTGNWKHGTIVYAVVSRPSWPRLHCHGRIDHLGQRPGGIGFRIVISSSVPVWRVRRGTPIKRARCMDLTKFNKLHYTSICGTLLENAI